MVASATAGEPRKVLFMRPVASPRQIRFNLPTPLVHATLAPPQHPISTGADDDDGRKPRLGHADVEPIGHIHVGERPLFKIVEGRELHVYIYVCMGAMDEDHVWLASEESTQPNVSWKVARTPSPSHSVFSPLTWEDRYTLKITRICLPHRNRPMASSVRVRLNVCSAHGLSFSTHLRARVWVCMRLFF